MAKAQRALNIDIAQFITPLYSGQSLMPLPKTAKSISDAEKASKVSYREFIKITLWAAGLVQKAVPLQFNIYLVTRVIGSFDPLVQAYLFAKILDAAVIVYNDPTRSFIPVYTALIFDEPTASIDAVSEYNIFNRIYEFFKNKTVIIISHRFSTVRNADRILVMEDGAIIEEGTHTHLMAKNGYYAKAFLLQAEGYVSS